MTGLTNLNNNGLAGLIPGTNYSNLLNLGSNFNLNNINNQPIPNLSHEKETKFNNKDSKDCEATEDKISSDVKLENIENNFEIGKEIEASENNKQMEELKSERNEVIESIKDELHEPPKMEIEQEFKDNNNQNPKNDIIDNDNDQVGQNLEREKINEDTKLQDLNYSKSEEKNSEKPFEGDIEEDIKKNSLIEADENRDRKASCRERV